MPIIPFYLCRYISKHPIVYKLLWPRLRRTGKEKKYYLTIVIDTTTQISLSVPFGLEWRADCSLPFARPISLAWMSLEETDTKLAMLSIDDNVHKRHHLWCALCTMLTSYIELLNESKKSKNVEQITINNYSVKLMVLIYNLTLALRSLAIVF